MRTSTKTAVAFVFWSALCVACGASLSKSAIEHPVDFAYEMEGELHRLAESRRRPVMVVLMRTSELVSQIYMREVAQVFQKRAGTLKVLVLTIEQTEKPFIDAYVQIEKLPFAIGVAEKGVSIGASSLGAIQAVPATYLIDDAGRVVHIAYGVIVADVLVSKIDDLLDI